MSLFLKRDTKVYLEKVGATTEIWEIPVMDGFSFSQANTTSEITINEMATAAGVTRRGRRVFNDALAPAEWSFSTYIRPFVSPTYSATVVTTALVAANSGTRYKIVTPGTTAFSSLGVNSIATTAVNGTGTTATITFATQAAAPFPVGSTILVEGVTAAGYNGVYTVTACTTTTVSYANATTGAATVQGIVANACFTYNGATATGTGTVIPAGIADTAANHHAVEEVLWANFVGLGTYTRSTYSFANITANTTSSTVAFTGGTNITLGTFNLYFVMGAALDADYRYDNPSATDILVYKITDCVVDQATLNFDVDGIAMVEWSGMGSTLAKVANFDAHSAITDGVNATSNFIRNKLTALQIYAGPAWTTTEFTAFPGTAVTVTAAAAGSNGLITGNRYRINTAGTTNWTGIGAAAATVGTVFTYNGTTTTGSGGIVDTGGYTITLTGGSSSFSNNVNFLTPEVLGIVNTPIGHVAGNKNISGNFTAYIDETAAIDTSAEFIDRMLRNTSKTSNQFRLIFTIGGTGNTPRMELVLPTAHLEIPVVQTDDIIALDVAFHGLPSSISSSDEATLTYTGRAL